MPRRPIRCLAVLAVLLLSPLCAWAVDWQSDYAAALQRARSERKLLIVEVRNGQCSACNDEMESPAEAVWNDPALAPQLDHYLFVRVPETEARVAPSGLLASVNRQAKAPSITLADSSETPILIVKPRTQQATKLTFAMMIIADPAVRQIAISSAALRLAGNTADADAGLGRVLMHLAQWKAAISAFDSAARQFRVAGLRDEAQRSEIWTAFCWYRSSSEAGMREASRARGTGHAILANVTRRPSSPEVEAQAWHIRGLLYLADASREASCCVVRPGSGATLQDLEHADRTIPGKDRRQAIEAFRKAYVIAPAGSPVIEAARTQIEAIDDQPLPTRADALSRATVRLTIPARRPLTGNVEVSLDSDIPVHSVDYFVDDLRVASSDSKPFSAKVDLGSVPTLRTIKAVARDANGNAVGEAVQTVNDRADALHVAITSPAKDAVPATIGVEATVDVPPGRQLRSVEFFFNDAKFGTLAEPPFRHALAVNGRFGYIRVIATLDDGTTGEDSRLVNAGGQSESVAVQGVTLIATVVDKSGKRVDGLKPSDFVVKEEGTPVDASAVNGAVEDPVTIGFAVDSSESMGIAMLFAKDLANRFFESSLRPADRMFLVSFDTVPRLVQGTTSDAKLLQAAAGELNAIGGTSIFDGIVFTLQQFQNVPGKKALVVVSDGGEGHSSSNAKACVQLAKALGIPIYGIVPPAGARLFNPLSDLASMTGGLFVYAPARAEFPALATRIRDEVRGQYLITFVSKLPPKPGAWRSLKVAVPSHPGAEVRTIGGYFAK